LSDIKIDKILRSWRKTVSLQITTDARLIVRAPFLAPEKFIYELVRQKKDWIKAKQEYFIRRQVQTPARKFVPGEEYLILGRSYALSPREDLPQAVAFDGNALMISPFVLGNGRDHLERWYKKKALEYLTERTAYFAQSAGLKYRSVRISRAKTLWGSCGHKDTLNFSWRIIMAPGDVVDYVIVHELMHIIQRNHSRQFWAEVAAIMPDYRQKERWLKQNGHLLIL
jgi:predicted metal-dependent hydrolase